MLIALILAVILNFVKGGQDEEITTQIDILENIIDLTTYNPIEIATHNFVQDLLVSVEPFVTERHIDDFSNDDVNEDNTTRCRCPRKRKICENGEKPVFRRNHSPCADGSKPRCPAKRCSKPIVIIDDITTEIDPELLFTLEPFSTEKHIDDFPTDDNKVKNKRCKCPRKRKICENGGKPVFRKNRPRCADGSKTRCPAKRCSKPTATAVEISTHIDIIEVIHDFTTDAPLETVDTVGLFSTERHVDPFVTKDPNEDNLDIHLNTESTIGEASLSTIDFSTEKNVDPFPELATLSAEEDRVFPALFSEKLEINASTTPQCLQKGIDSCTGVSVNTDLLETLTEGRVVMLLAGSDFTMELTNSPSALNSESVAYSFLLSTGGSATMTVGQNDDPDKEPSVFASVNTHRKWMFFVESCGEECTVLYKRDSDFFNKFED